MVGWFIGWLVGWFIGWYDTLPKPKLPIEASCYVAQVRHSHSRINGIVAESLSSADPICGVFCSVAVPPAGLLPICLLINAREGEGGGHVTEGVSGG